MGWSKGGVWSGDSGWSAAAGPADAAQTTAFLARTSGLSGTETAAYKALINGMVADGTWALLDALYIFATKDTTTANLNLVSTSFGLTQTGTVTFAADHGYTGDGSTGFLNTNYNPSTAGGVATLSSRSIGAYVQSSRTSSNNAVEIGYLIGSDNTFIQPETGGTCTYEFNGGAFPGFANANAQGFYAATRTGLNATAIYKNGSGTASATAANTGGALGNGNVFISASNGGGTAGNFSPDQLSAAFIGGGLSSANAVLVSNRINGYMTALGINVY